MIHATIREAIHTTATCGRPQLKEIAPHLDWSPSELSMRITLGGESARPFPIDDGRIVKLMRIVSDYSILETLADQCGFEIVPKRDQTPQRLASLHRDVQEMAKRVNQLVLDLGVDPPARPKR